GIPRSPTSDFLHPARDLTLSARLADRSGAAIAVVRRKNKPQLADPDGRELGPDALAPLLGGVGRDVFERAFGLDAARLRLSGAELRDTGGELGAALFSAAAGLRGLDALRLALTEEAAELFAPTG
ncbi:AAA family ATPase, partial [Mycobacterium tuberculosis]|nr:AAA family ATPase [Mycobacterium tuberculosis]